MLDQSKAETPSAQTLNTVSQCLGHEAYTLAPMGLGDTVCSSSAQASCGLFLELTPLSASSFPCLVSDISDISNILVISISTEAIPS